MSNHLHQNYSEFKAKLRNFLILIFISSFKERFIYNVQFIVSLLLFTLLIDNVLKNFHFYLKPNILNFHLIPIMIYE